MTRVSELSLSVAAEEISSININIMPAMRTEKATEPAAAKIGQG